LTITPRRFQLPDGAVTLFSEDAHARREGTASWAAAVFHVLALTANPAARGEKIRSGTPRPSPDQGLDVISRAEPTVRNTGKDAHLAQQRDEVAQLLRVVIARSSAAFAPIQQRKIVAE
jgi:hypothetical protein